jgi:hypothetical protein
MTREVAEQQLIPGHDLRHQLGHDDFGILGQVVERGLQAVAHAQTTDQDPRLGAATDACTTQLGKTVLRRVRPAIHELGVVNLNRVILLELIQPQPTVTARNRGCIQMFP